MTAPTPETLTTRVTVEFDPAARAAFDALVAAAGRLLEQAAGLATAPGFVRFRAAAALEALGSDEPPASPPPGLRAQLAAMLAEADEPEALLEAVRGIIADRQHAIAQVGRLYADRNALACALAQAIQLAGGVAGVMSDPHETEARFARAVVIHLPGAGRVGWHLDALDPAPAARLAAFPGAWETWPPEENRARLERFLASPPTPIPSRLLGWASDVEDTAASPAATLEGVAATLRRDLAPEPETVVAEVEAAP